MDTPARRAISFTVIFSSIISFHHRAELTVNVHGALSFYHYTRNTSTNKREGPVTKPANNQSIIVDRFPRISVFASIARWNKENMMRAIQMTLNHSHASGLYEIALTIIEALRNAPDLLIEPRCRFSEIVALQASPLKPRRLSYAMTPKASRAMIRDFRGLSHRR
jgi:hypothetical protein